MVRGEYFSRRFEGGLTFWFRLLAISNRHILVSALGVFRGENATVCPANLWTLLFFLFCPELKIFCSVVGRVLKFACVATELVFVFIFLRPIAGRWVSCLMFDLFDLASAAAVLAVFSPALPF